MLEKENSLACFGSYGISLLFFGVLMINKLVKIYSIVVHQDTVYLFSKYSIKFHEFYITDS